VLRNIVRNDRVRLQPSVLIESVEALVQAIGAGTVTVELEGKVNDQYKRYAPSFVAGKASSSESDEHPYTVDSIAKFLGKTKKRGRGKDSA
jgi:hypothetical protein